MKLLAGIASNRPQHRFWCGNGFHFWKGFLACSLSLLIWIETVRERKLGFNCELPNSLPHTHTNSATEKKLTRKNAFYGQVFCTVVTKRFGGFQKHLVFVLNVKIKDRMRPKEFSFPRREDRLPSTSFLQACIKDVLGVTKRCSSGSQRSNLKKWKLHFNFCLLNKKFFPLFECWWKKLVGKGKITVQPHLMIFQATIFSSLSQPLSRQWLWRYSICSILEALFESGGCFYYFLVDFVVTMRVGGGEGNLK